jgi:hypothetical protein
MPRLELVVPVVSGFLFSEWLQLIAPPVVSSHRLGPQSLRNGTALCLAGGGLLPHPSAVVIKPVVQCTKAIFELHSRESATCAEGVMGATVSEWRKANDGH